MNERVKEMASKVGASRTETLTCFAVEELEAFYKTAFNDGIAVAAKVARSYEPTCDVCPSGVESAIRKQEMK